MTLNTVKMPTLNTVREVASELGMTFGDEDLAAHLRSFGDGIVAYDIIDKMTDELPAVKYPRLPGYRPPGDENKYNAWYVKTTIEGAPQGKKIVLKDNVLLAGVPMMNGASTPEGSVPDVDATIVGKSVCEHFCFSGGSHTSSTGSVHNPHRMGYSAGGSSSGSAALGATGGVPMAIGGDQGGSIRMPASYCGIDGMTPTHGLVRYTSILPIELTIDHAGPTRPRPRTMRCSSKSWPVRTGSIHTSTARPRCRPIPRRSARTSGA